MTEVYRNHPVAMLKNAAAALVALFFIAISIESYICFAVMGALVVLIVISWYASTLTVYEDHAEARFDFIVKKKTIIPFGKVAAVNEVKSILARMFGCTTVQININSSQNASKPEVSFILKDDIAARIVPLLKYGSGISDTEKEDTETEENEATPTDVPVFEFGLASAIIFGLVGSSTYSLASSAFWGIFSVISMFTDSSASYVTIFMFILTGVIPIIGSILKHGNFRVYRSGTTIRLVYGMITLYDTSFDVSKVNAVCVKRAFFPKLAKRCCLQAEVVGINAEKNSTTPNVTLLIPERDLKHAMEALFPEFITDYDVNLQPPAAKYPTFSMPTYVSLGFAGLAVLAYLILDLAYGGMDDYLYAFVIPCVAFAVLMYVRAFFALRIRRIGYGEELFTSVNGILDTSEYTMQYSKVQIANGIASPRCRRHGLVKLHISLLSSEGKKIVTTGFFDKDDAERISEKTVEMSGCKLDAVDVKNNEMYIVT